MRIAVASGKGGTGKTTVAASLARVRSDTGQTVGYLDCDVEEPNGHLFLHPILESSESVTVPVPEVDSDTCTGCGRCGEICQYSAITCLRGKVLTFPELCHGCGGCTRVCPAEAIGEVGREIGVLESGRSDSIRFVHGRLNIGETMSAPLIHRVRAAAGADDLSIIDAPPGTSCPVIAAIHNVDAVLLVTEPTPFGLSDLALAIDMVRALNLAHAVVVNRHEEANASARQFCREHGVDIIGEVPDDRRVAEAYSRGELPVDVLADFRALFHALGERVCEWFGAKANA